MFVSRVSIAKLGLHHSFFFAHPQKIEQAKTNDTRKSGYPIGQQAGLHQCPQQAGLHQCPKPDCAVHRMANVFVHPTIYNVVPFTNFQERRPTFAQILVRTIEKPQKQRNQGNADYLKGIG